MKHEIIPIMAAVMWGLSLFALPAQAQYGGGSGTPEEPYLIFDANQMNAIGADSNDWDKNFKLMADIDLSAYTETAFNIIGTGYYECTPIGFCYFVGTPFTGSFDGNNHKISNFTYISTETDSIDCIGMFGVVDGVNAEIKNLGLIDATIDVGLGNQIGSLVGYLVNGTVSDCYVEGGTVSADYRVGGLIGSTGSTTQISNCHATGNILGQYDIGGLVGSNYGKASECYSVVSIMGYAHVGGLVGYNSGSISKCYSTGSISATSYVGGLVGENIGQISNCYSESNISEGSVVGGLVGWNYYGTISNCYSTGSVSGDSRVGGLVGANDGTITCCYSTGSVMGDEYVGGLVGGNGNGGTITNCYSTSSVSGTGWQVGGLVGWNSGTITDCYSTSSVSGGSLVGGLVGYNPGTITGCYSTGSVSGDSRVGGLVGRNGGLITDCYVTGSVKGENDVGGLVGSNWEGTITNCYATGSVSGDRYVGGMVGENYRGTVSTSFWDIETSGQDLSDGGTGLPTDQMQTASTFALVGWGCGSVWTIDEGKDYPRLWWENAPGELITTPSYGGGSGEPNDPYLIYTAEHLNMIGWILCDLDKHFKLMADIDLSSFTGTSFNIIGYYVSSSNNKPFTGVFDGSDHGISNFTYASTGTHRIGLFGYVSGENAEIRNLGLIDPDVDGGTRDYVGSLVGRLWGGTITNCYIHGGSVSGDSRVGGLVGHNSGTITNCRSETSVSGNEAVGGLAGANGGTITNCYSTSSVSGTGWEVGGLVGANGGTITNCYSSGSVSGDAYVGGLVGRNSSTITNCYSSGSVSGNKYIGGLVGYNEESTITNCYAAGRVSGTRYVGGLVGFNRGWCSGGTPPTCYYGTIINCYSTGSVEGVENVGGLVGRNWVGEVNNSFWDIETSGRLYSSGGIGLPTAEMQTISTFTDSGWDFVGETFNGIEDIWFIPQQDYPHLWWEGFQVSMKLTPRTLNCRSQGNWVKAHLTLPQGFSVADVDADRPAVLHSFGFESTPLYVFVNKNELVEIEAAFERQAVCSLAGDWPQMLTVAGFLTDGNIFLGTSKVRIIHPGMKVIEELANYWLQGDCVHPTWCDGIDMNRDSLVNLLDYALLMNIKVEFVSE